MACRLVGAKPLSEPMLLILLIEPLGTNQWNFNRNYNIFSQENAYEYVVWKMAAILSRPQCVKLYMYTADEFYEENFMT